MYVAFAVDLSGLNCTFEPGSSCKWSNSRSAGDNLDWKIQVAGNNGWKNYAKTDHTTGSKTGI